MYEIDILSRITENISQFSRAEQKAAQVILDDIMFSVRASISELAKRATVSEATITRLAKSLGCKNVRDLKVQLAQAAMVGERFLREVNVEPSGISGVYEAAIKILNQNAKLIDQKKTGFMRFQVCRGEAGSHLWRWRGQHIDGPGMSVQIVQNRYFSGGLFRPDVDENDIIHGR